MKKQGKGKDKIDFYSVQAYKELVKWQKKMTKRPSLTGLVAKEAQTRVNNLYPESFHQGMTVGIKKIVQGVLAGSEFISSMPITGDLSLQQREAMVREKIAFYKKAGAAEGAGTGAGGIFLGLADFPLLLSIKFKLLFDMAVLYGFNVGELRERVYILYVFQLAFSSEKRRAEVYHHLLHWDDWVKKNHLTMNTVDWRIFQQEYRDYIDLAKMLQLMPGIGAAVGAVANYRLIDKLGDTGMNCYRMRLL
jgi:hypothetical protein